MNPTNPVDAVTHPTPGPYYDALAARPMTWDDSLGLWVASRADDVRAVLGHPAARVRPLDAPVPPGLAGTGAGDVFGRLVRMRDDDDRTLMKDAIADAVGSLDVDRVAQAVTASTACVARVDEQTGEFVDRWIAEVPLGAVAHLIGIDRADLVAAVEASRALAACFGPVPPGDAAARADRAVDVLSGLATSAAERGVGLAAAIRRAVPDHRVEDALANTIGLLFQTADATAGLCANTLVRLAGGDAQRPDEFAATVADVSRNDPAVHSTRRWFAAAAQINGASIAAGDAVLVVLAAANRDPAAGESSAFGSGVHRCPGSDLAATIAALTVAALVEPWPGLLADVRSSGYRALPNVRIPTFVRPIRGRARSGASRRRTSYG